VSDQPRKRVLGDRYEIDAVLGQGGMAKVFRGKDRVLNRTVAVKVLSPQFAGDGQFVARFRREAQAAAGLNHPHIVSVFDTGDQGDVHYIVMEYVQGRTLRDAIRDGGRLLPDRAVEVAESVARALAAAHEAGLVHRDVKPGNIMLTPEGEVKVMDFGIARTTTGDTLTQTAAVLGTASYLSPEQAQGQTVDARSDIYSLGCVLYEMLTGAAPFTGDSPVSIAYKHVKEDPVPPRRLNPDVTPDLEAVVMKMLAKNPANRYQTADELREDLNRLAQGRPILATPVLGGDATEVVTRQGEGTAVLDEVPPDERGPRSRRWLVFLAVLLGLGLLALAAYFLVQSLLVPEAEPFALPNVVGQAEEEATTTLERRNLEVRVESRFDEQAPRDEVIAQDPEAGAQVEEGDTVTLTVSRGVRPVGVPNLIGETEEAAANILAQNDLEVGSVTEEESESPEDTVVDQNPAAGVRVEPGSEVDLVISSGPATVTVPRVVCEDLDTAQDRIEGAGLEFEVAGSEFSEECEPGTVASQDPAGGEEVEDGSTVVVTESEGPEPTPPPTITPTPTITDDG